MSNTVIRANNIKLQKGDKVILHDLSLEVRPNEIISLVGDNGAGKTSLFRVLLGLENKIEGEVWFGDIDMVSGKRIEALSKIGVMFGTELIYEYLTGKENLNLMKNYYNNPSIKVGQLIELFSLGDFINKKANTYSSGMKQRLAIAMAFINRPDLFLLDEPFNAVDKTNTNELLEIIKRIHSEYNTSFVVISHSFDHLEKIYTRLVVMETGKIVYDKSRDDISMTGKTIQTVYNEL